MTDTKETILSSPKARRLVARALREMRARLAEAGDDWGDDDPNDIVLIDVLLGEIAAADRPVAATATDEENRDVGGPEEAGSDGADGCGAAAAVAAKAERLRGMALVLDGGRRWDCSLDFEAVVWALLDADPDEDAQGIAYALEHGTYSTFRDDYWVGRYLTSLDAAVGLAVKLGHPVGPLLAKSAAGLRPKAAGKEAARAFLAALLRAEATRLAPLPEA